MRDGSVLLATWRTDEDVAGAADSRSDGRSTVDAGPEPSRRSPATEAAGTFREPRGTASFSWDLTDLRPGMKFYAAPTNLERTRRSDATLSK